MAAKIRVSKKSKSPRHAPLGQQLEDAPRQRRRARAAEQADGDAAAAAAAASEAVVGAKLTQNILDLARAQQLEEEQETQEALDRATRQALAEARAGHEDDAADFDDMDSDAVIAMGGEEDGAELYQALQLQPEDELLLNQFMPAQPAPRLTLADMIMGKIREQQTELASQMSAAGGPSYRLPSIARKKKEKRRKRRRRKKKEEEEEEEEEEERKKEK